MDKEQRARNGSVIRVMEDELGKARQNLKSAQSSLSMFGHYDDCGPSYRQDYYEAKAVAEYLEKLLPELRKFKQ